MVFVASISLGVSISIIDYSVKEILAESNACHMLFCTLILTEKHNDIDTIITFDEDFKRVT